MDWQWVWWFSGAIVLGIVEMFTLDFLFLMLAGGAIAGGAASLMGAPWWLSLTVAAIASLVLLLALRPFLLRAFNLRRAGGATNVDALAGREARTIDEVTETSGRVKLNGEVWSARTRDDAPPIPEGAEVVVLEIKGATAIVAPEEEGK